MRIGTGAFTYEWIDDWARVPRSDNGRTHAAAVLRDGRVVIFHQADPAVLIFDDAGNLLSSWGDYKGAHGMTLADDGGREVLWLTDEKTCVVRKHALDGELLQELPPPPTLLDRANKPCRYVPTWAAPGPDGDVWVADGYGSHGVYRFSRDGALKQTLTGEEGAGRFNEPHGLAFTPAGEVWITDRANHRVCVYDADGRFLRHKDGACHSPCCFTFRAGPGGLEAYVPELFTGVKVLDEKLNVLASLGDNPDVRPRPDGGWWPPVAPQGWPNLAGTPHVRAGVFNSPHGVAASPAGDVFVTEWILGGRVTRLRRR